MTTIKKNHSHQQYWEQRYKQTICEHYQWMSKPQPIISLLNKHGILQKGRKFENILQIGCGTSHLMKHLVKQIRAQKKQEEDLSITAIDFSKEVIKKMRNSPLSQNTTYLVHDITQNSNGGKENKVLQDNKFDLIIDKGTIDCLFCQQTSMIKNVIKGLRQCYRVLNQGGIMVSISHGKPKFRMYLFRNRLVPFRVSYEMLVRQGNNSKEVYVYFLRKGEGEGGQMEGAIGQMGSEEEEGGDDQQKDKSQINEEEQMKDSKKDEQKQNKTQSEHNFILKQEKQDESANQQKSNQSQHNFILKQQHAKQQKEQQMDKKDDEKSDEKDDKKSDENKSEQSEHNFILKQEQGQQSKPELQKQQAQYEMDSDFEQI